LGYYGLGNDTQYSRDSVTTAGSYFYKVSRTTLFARVSVQRRVVGPLRILAGATIDHSDFRALPGRSVFGSDLAAGVIDPGTIPFTDKVIRAGVVLDTRDNEIDPHRGVAELAVRLLRNSLLCMGYGHGSDGGRFLFGTSWSY